MIEYRWLKVIAVFFFIFRKKKRTYGFCWTFTNICLGKGDISYYKKYFSKEKGKKGGLKEEEKKSRKKEK